MRDAPSARQYRRPHRNLWRSEPWRASVEIGQFWASLPRLLDGDSGDGHSVLVIPGLLGDDLTTVALRGVLRARGYDAVPWRLGPNIGPTARIVRGVFGALDELHERSDRRVSVIGWSLGGFFARELARHRPDQVRSVITLGTPLRLRHEDEPSTSRVGWVYDALRPWHSGFFTGVPREEHRPPVPVPTTAVYSRTDGVVPWRACLAHEDRHSENVEVETSHSGMGFHPSVLRVVLDRLAQPEGAWRPYRATRPTSLHQEGIAS